MNEGTTNSVPKMYHGMFLPNLVLVLSIKKPIMLVATPSAICPDRMASVATVRSAWITSMIKYNKYINQIVHHRSL